MATQLNDRQQYLLTLLEENDAALGRAKLSDLLAKRYTVSKITLVRDLNLLLDEGLIKTVGSGPGTKYCSDTATILRVFEPTPYFEVIQDNRALTAQDNEAFFAELADIDLLTDAEKVRLDESNSDFQHRVTTREPDVYRRELQRFTVELAWKSSRIEGNTYSLLETEELLKTKQGAAGHTTLETQMILNHKTALDVILANLTSFVSFSITDVMDIHQALTQNLNIESGIRRQPVGITGTNYLPADNEFVLREQLARALEIANEKKHPVEAAIILSGLIAYLQPFVDGNKRTARLVGNAILLAHDYAALSYRGVDEVAYKEAVLLIDEQHSFYQYKQMFIEQFLFAAEHYFL